MEKYILIILIGISLLFFIVVNFQSKNRNKIITSINDFVLDYRNTAPILDTFISNKGKVRNFLSTKIVFLLKLLIATLYLFITVIIVLYTALSNVITDEKYTLLSKIFSHIVTPFVLTSIFIKLTAELNNQSIIIIRTYYHELLKMFELKSLHNFIIVILGIVFSFRLFKCLEKRSSNNSDIKFSQFFILTFGSMITSVIFIAFIASYFILSDYVIIKVASNINKNIPTLDVYAIIGLYYSACLLIIKLTYEICIKPIAEKLSQLSNNNEEH
ncbi:TPA: hypothetical protein ACHVEJ_000783 [Streptococcus suis]